MRTDRGHGSPYDRGRADSYYGRGFNPHYFIQDTYRSQEITLVAMTGDEILEYAQGYKENETSQNFKDWG